MKSNKATKVTLPPGYMHVSDLAKLPPVKWQIEGFYEQNSIVLHYGAKGTLKSYFTLDLLCSIATGEPWHGYDVQQPGRVVYVVAESINNLHARISAWEDEHYASTEGNLICRGGINLGDQQAWNRFVSEMKGLKPTVIAFSPLQMMSMGVDENSMKEFGPIVNRFEELRRATGALVVVEHHTSAEGKRPRGHTVLEGLAFTGVLLEKSNGVVTATWHRQRNAASDTKMRFSIIAESNVSPVILRQTEHRTTTNTTRRPKASKTDVVVLKFVGENPNCSHAEIIAALNIAKSTASNSLTRLKELGKITESGKRYSATEKEKEISVADVPGVGSGRRLPKSRTGIKQDSSSMDVRAGGEAPRRLRRTNRDDSPERRTSPGRNTNSVRKEPREDQTTEAATGETIEPAKRKKLVRRGLKKVVKKPKTWQEEMVDWVYEDEDF